MGFRTRSRLVRKQTLNYLTKLPVSVNSHNTRMHRRMGEFFWFFFSLHVISNNELCKIIADVEKYGLI